MITLVSAVLYQVIHTFPPFLSYYRNSSQAVANIICNGLRSGMGMSPSKTMGHCYYDTGRITLTKTAEGCEIRPWYDCYYDT